MKHTKYILLVLFVIMNTGTANADSTNNIIDSVQKWYDDTSSIKGNFKQISFLKSLKRNQVSTGVVYFKRPGKMRWEYQSPEKQLIVSDGKTLWFYISEDKQVMKKKIDGEKSNIAQNVFLLGNGKLRKVFDIQLDNSIKGLDTRFYLLLEPKEPIPNVKNMVIGVNKKNFQVEESTLIDYFGNTTKVIISNIEKEIKISDDKFIFSPGSNVKIIEEK